MLQNYAHNTEAYIAKNKQSKSGYIAGRDLETNLQHLGVSQNITKVNEHL